MQPKGIITHRSLQSTILRDPQTCYWFAKALTSPEMNPLFEGDQGMIKNRGHLKSLIWYEQALFFILIPAWGAYFLLSHRVFPTLLGGSLTIALLLVLEHIKSRRTAKMATWTLEKALPDDDTSSWTLYQLTEHLGKHYGLKTLVDVIAGWDWTLRKILLVVYTITTFLLFMPYLKILAACILALSATALLLRVMPFAKPLDPPNGQ